MKVLVIGGGGREHAIAWRIAKSTKVTNIFIAPGNAGTINHGKILNVDLGENYNIKGLSKFAKDENIDLTIVGPEKFLVEGIVDFFESTGLSIIGPTKLAARLEGSKNFSKSFMLRNSIPTSSFRSFSSAVQAKQYIKNHKFPLVIKADGLASGKGVTIVHSLADGNLAIEDYLEKKRFGSSSTSIVIEEFVAGREVSFIALTDGKTIFPFPTCQDHKRLLDNDQGPNTGGMGAYSPVAFVDQNLYDRIIKEVIRPTIDGMKKEGSPYAGFLYAGLMISSNDEITVLEYNCRLGDPEAQILMMKMNGDFFELLNLASNKSLDKFNGHENFWDSRASLGVVVASGGYPENPKLGEKIEISSDMDINDDQLQLFHAGTDLKDGVLKTSGGRVLCFTVLEPNLFKAREKVYSGLTKVHFERMQYRQDIGENKEN